MSLSIDIIIAMVKTGVDTLQASFSFLDCSFLDGGNSFRPAESVVRVPLRSAAVNQVNTNPSYSAIPSGWRVACTHQFPHLLMTFAFLATVA
jgi:hypothetical protein